MSAEERLKGPQELATEEMIAAAEHLDGAEFAGAKAALLGMARKLDGWDAVVQAAVEWAEEASGRRPRVPTHDGTTYGTYMRALAELGLTPISRAKLEAAGENLHRRAERATKAKEAADDDDHSSDSADGGKLATISALRA